MPSLGVLAPGGNSFVVFLLPRALVRLCHPLSHLASKAKESWRRVSHSAEKSKRPLGA